MKRDLMIAITVLALGFLAYSGFERYQAGTASAEHVLVSKSDVPHKEAADADPVGGKSGSDHGASAVQTVAAMPSEEAVASAKAKRIRELDERMLSEPVSARWADRNTRNIQEFLAPENLRANGLAEAQDFDVECRTDICRLDLTFADEISADQTLQALFQQVANALPSAEIYQSADDSGGIRVLVYAKTGNTAPTAPFQKSSY